MAGGRMASLCAFVLLIIGCVFLVVEGRPPCPCSDSSLCTPITTPARKEVLAFLVSNDNWRKYDWDILTTIAVFTDFDNELLCFAHSKGVRVVLSADYPVANLTDAAARKAWIDSTVESIYNSYADGVNLDFESAVAANSGQELGLTELSKDLVAAVHNKIGSGSQVTFDVAWSPNCIDKRCYNYQALADVMDFVVIMAYDLMSQIFPPKPCIAGPNSAFPSVVDGINDFIGLGIDPSKLVLGVPWYGRDYPCTHPANATVCPIVAVPFRGAPCSDAVAPEIDYGVLLKMIEENSIPPGRRWNNYFKSPYFDYKDPQTGAIHQLWYDDVESLSYKYEFAKLMDLRGIAMWNSDSLDYTNPAQVKSMWGAIQHHFL